MNSQGDPSWDHEWPKMPKCHFHEKRNCGSYWHLQLQMETIVWFQGCQGHPWVLVCTCCGCCLKSAVEMSLSKEEKPKVCREQIDILDYPSAFGDLSPIEGFKGPKKPSRRQVLRHLLHLVSNNCTLKDAADRVVSEILAKHPTETETAKSTRRLSKWLWGSNEKTYTVMNKSFQTSGPKDSKAREKYFKYFSVSKSE